MRDIIRVIIADDHDVVVAGIAEMLSQHLDMQIVCTLSSGTELSGAIQKYQPHILLTDLKMKDSDPIRLLKTLQDHPNSPRVIVISGMADLYIVSQGAELGLAGYLLKEEGLAGVLPRAIRIVHNGGQFFSESLQKALTDSIRPRRNYGLTEEQFAVLCLMVSGLTNAQIVAKTGKKPTAVYSQIGRIVEALSVETREQAIILAIKEKIVPLHLLGFD